MIAIASLLVVVTLSLLVTRVATVVLVATGMSRHSARFQARSAFTGSGFTTRESEEVVNHPIRRRVVLFLMLLGNAGIVAGAGSLIIGFRGGGSTQWKSAAELLAGLAGLLLLARSSWVDRRLTRTIRRVLIRHTDVHTRDIASLLDLTGNFSVAELAVEPGDWLAGRPLSALGLRQEGVMVLGVNRPDGTQVKVPGSWTVIRPEDTVIIYGRSDGLEELDHRPSGEDGDRRHELAVARQEALTRGEQLREQAEPVRNSS